MGRQDNLIVGLGNPGTEYEDTKHNVGFLVIDALYRNFDTSAMFKEKWNGLSGSISYSGEKLHFLKPQTYMNRSGQSVAKHYSFYKIVPEKLIVVHDDLDMAPGRVKLVKGGGAGGHNGIKSIVSSIGTNDFYRLKIGIGRPGQGDIHRDFPVEKYVLSNLSTEERSILQERYAPIINGMKHLIRGDVGRAKGVLNSLK